MKDILTTLVVNAAVFSVLFGLMLLVRRLMSKKISAVLQYALWAVLVIKLMIPFGFESSISPLSLLASGEDNTAMQTQAVWAADVPSAQSSVDMSVQNDIAPAGTETINDVAGPDAVQNTEVSEQPAQTYAQAPMTIDWTTWVFAVWMAGLVITAALAIRDTYKLRRDINRTKTALSNRAMRIFEACKRQLGINREVKVLRQTVMSEPMVMNALRPVVVLPGDIEARDDAQISHICMHELTHVKHGDLTVITLLNMLQAVYWFNPFTWLCFRLIRKDMETACDARVISRLGNSARLGYIGTVLHFAGCEKEKRLYAAMGMADGRLTMEQRIRGMYKKARTGVKTRIAALCIAVVMLSVCVLTACQPTPEQEVVANKNTTDLVEDVVAANNAEDTAELEEDKKTIAEQINASDGRLTMQITPNDQVTIDIDADIVIPEYDQIPMVRVKPENFSQEQFDTFIAYLTGGNPVYYQNEYLTGSIFTKEEIMTIQTKIQGYLANEDLPGNIRSPWEYMLGELKKEYDNAMSQADEELYDGELTVPENEEKEVELDNGVVAVYGSHDTSKSRTSLKCYMGKSRAAWLNMVQTQEGNQTQMSFDNNDYGSAYNTFGPYEGVDAANIEMTYEEARAMAEDFARTIDGTDTGLVIYQSSIGYELETIAGYSKETSPNAYVFRFARSFDGALVKQVGYLTGANENIDYNKRVSPESLFVVIDDGGIVDAYWSNRMEYVEDIASDVPLKDFDTISETFENYCRYKFAWTYRNDALAEDATPAVTLKVKRVEMNFMVVPEKDNLETYIMVPVWDFIADMTLDEEQMSQEGFLDEGQQDVSILTINAIDGTVIDREQGY